MTRRNLAALYFTNPSKVERAGFNTSLIARKAIEEGDNLRVKLSGRRILECA